MSGGQNLRGRTNPEVSALLAAEATRRAAQAPATEERPAGRHCWVSGPPEAPGPWPGVIITWARRGNEWRGRAVYVVQEAEGPVVVDAWVPAPLLRPAG